MTDDFDATAFRAAAWDYANDALIAIDTDGIIRAWNLFAEKLFGWSAEDVIGQDVKIMTPERLRAAHDRGFFAAMESGHLASDGRARRTKSCENIYVTMTFAVISDASGAAIGAAAVAREWERDAD
ncbi:PAS domain S-box protein [Propioniciclava sinopodophylli]|uniref:PAS domain S-box protein n=1 Tax=Propioniciclava sinopodophylli TaxID=1837344 RepID=A0A4Q9KDV8_9ACTN|nr:PAS domain S-box protein [Propioniciclava sinopodophylli]TBT85060.1 PAS domain S-box protein [Propioniciclava sinopodophylli]